MTSTNNGLNTYLHHEPFHCVNGSTLAQLKLVFETYGELSPSKDNVIVIHHALSPDCHVNSHEKNLKNGWWEGMVGPGKAIDSNQYFIICINNLGSPFGATNPSSINPETNKPYGPDFPTITMLDIVNSQRQILHVLDIKNIFAIIGNSMGGMISLTWAFHYPDEVTNLICVASCYKAYPANIANRAVQAEIIKLDPDWNQGHYTKSPLTGLKVARKLGHCTYRNPNDLNQKFMNDGKSDPDKVSEIENYLEYNANKFASQFDPNAYLLMLKAMDLYNLCNKVSDPAMAFSKIQANVLVISFGSDVLYTPNQQEDLYQALTKANVNTQIIHHNTPYGHDAFLIEIDAMGAYIRNFLSL